MEAIDAALQLDSYAPQWTAIDAAASMAIGAADGNTSATGAASAASYEELRKAYEQLPQRLPPLNSEELEQLRQEPDVPWPLSDYERSLLRRSLESLDYNGDWADPTSAQDSIVLTCQTPDVEYVGPDKVPEFTCSFDRFTAERHELHVRIVEKMLTSSRTLEGARHDSGISLPTTAVDGSKKAVPAAALRRLGGPPALPLPSPDEQHVFIVVGVPGSGKDTVLKRYLRSLGLPLLDASADLIKEYLAAWGQDELSREVRENNAHHGPGKHLLHAQYLHRESILICDTLVERALARGDCLLVEKTLWNLEPVLRLARNFRRSGVRCHLLGTHIQPLRNWKFLEHRMASGQAFGRYITKEQALEGLVRYQQNVEAILEDEELGSAFDSLHMYDVMEDKWCVSL